MSVSAATIDSVTPSAADRLRPVRVWLYLVAALVLLMVAVGGMTRLTDSGLSITSWQPISGVIPPLSDADWQAEFDAYRHIPQFTVQNSWMTLADFKPIFWWEWTHRFLGRFIGLAFFVPFLVFLFQRRLSWRLAPALGLLFVMGGLQGFIGWWMVSSGLADRVDVSQYRLATHLGAAALLFASLVAVARGLGGPLRAAAPSRTEIVGAASLAGLVYLQIIAGAFVAGLDAGFGYNTWPLMDGALIPAGLGVMEPWWRNIFENALTVQFVHRSIAYTIVVFAAVLFWFQGRAGGFAHTAAWLPRIGVLILCQVALGITTLLLVVPLPLALGHQVLAFMLFGTAIAWLADIWRTTVL